MYKIYSVILAAGLSRRLGFSKLMVKIDGQTVIRRAVTPFLSASIGKVYVVAGGDASRLQQELEDLPLEVIPNPSFEEGMSSSVKAALPFLHGSEGVFFHLGDKPFIPGDILPMMIQAFRRGSPGLVVPFCGGTAGHPVLVRTGPYMQEMQALRGDRGLREVIEKHRADMVSIEGGEGILLDIDTLEDIEELRRRGYRIEEG